jgi:WD40 repeat protein
MYALREKKIGCISLNPVEQNYLACASNDRSATIWDIRHMKKTPKPILEFEHGYAVSSCYWSPNGKKILTTSYDNRLRVMSTDKQIKDMELEHSIEHNNRTGKYVILIVYASVFDSDIMISTDG